MNDEDFPPDPIIEEFKKGVDTSLLQENLRRTPEERLLAIMAMQRLVDEMRREISTKGR